MSGDGPGDANPERTGSGGSKQQREQQSEQQSEQDDEDQGPDAVRSALNRARAAARERGAIPGAPPAGSRRRRRPRDDGSRSGAHPDARDPQTVGAALDRLVAEPGWQEAVAVGGVMGRWDAVVGAESAGLSRPEEF